jgi:hypothetical protein
VKEVVWMYRGLAGLVVFLLYIEVTIPFTVGEREIENIHSLLVNNGGIWLLTNFGFAVYFLIAYMGAQACEKIERKDQAENISILAYIAAFMYAFASFVVWGMAEPDSGFFGLILGVFAMALSVLAGILLLPVFMYIVLHCFPYFLVAIYSTFITSKTTAVAKKHVNNSRPDNTFVLGGIIGGINYYHII